MKNNSRNANNLTDAVLVLGKNGFSQTDGFKVYSCSSDLLPNLDQKQIPPIGSIDA